MVPHSSITCPAITDKPSLKTDASDIGWATLLLVFFFSRSVATLDGGSGPFRSFLESCLEPDGKKRLKAGQLLELDFVKEHLPVATAMSKGEVHDDGGGGNDVPE